MTCKIGLWEWVERKGRRRWEENEEGDGKKMWEKEEEEDRMKRKCQNVCGCGNGWAIGKKLKNLKVLLLSKKVKTLSLKKKHMHTKHIFCIISTINTCFHNIF